MKNLMSIKSLILSLSIVFSMNISQKVFSDEPQLHLINGKKNKITKVKSIELAQYEINNSEMIQLFAFKPAKKLKQKIKLFKNEALAKNTLNKNVISL
jgi:hypothetical protein